MRLNNLVGKPASYKVPGGPELKATILGILPAASLLAEMDDGTFEHAISASTFRIALDTASVDGKRVVEVPGSHISGINECKY